MQYINPETVYPGVELTKEEREMREIIFNDFRAFFAFVCPEYKIGRKHEDLLKWLEDGYDENNMIIVAREHLKSTVLCVWRVFRFIRKPSLTVIAAYPSETLMQRGTRTIKDNLNKPIIKRFFPGLTPEETNRKEKWAANAFELPHWMKRESGKMDLSFIALTPGMRTTGQHADEIDYDDLVTAENSTDFHGKNGETERAKISEFCAFLTSVKNTGCITNVVGTYYNKKDQYHKMQELMHPVMQDGKIIGKKKAFRTFFAAIKDSAGEYFWPRVMYSNGETYGFDAEQEAIKRAEYESNGMLAQFYCQYYNNPDNEELSPIAARWFKYYDKKDLYYDDDMGCWKIYDYSGKMMPLRAAAAVDLAVTANKDSDYTAICVGAIDQLGNRYILEISRLKTESMYTVTEELKRLVQKWKIKKLRIEAVGTTLKAARDVKDYLESEGVRIPIELFSPGGTEKNIRMMMILQPLYEAGSIYHTRGGNCEILERELLSISSEHDDTKDATAMCFAPGFLKFPFGVLKPFPKAELVCHPRFGGVVG